MERGGGNGNNNNNNKNNVKQEGSLLALWLSNPSRATSMLELFRRGNSVHTPGKDYRNRRGANAGFQLPV